MGSNQWLHALCRYTRAQCEVSGLSNVSSSLLVGYTAFAGVCDSVSLQDCLVVDMVLFGSGQYLIVIVVFGKMCSQIYAPVMMELFQVSKMRDKILKYLISCCLTQFVPRWIRLSKASEMVDEDQDVLISS